MSIERQKVPARGKAVIVFNEAAGSATLSKKELLLHAAEDRFTRRGWDVEIKRTTKAGEEVDLAAAAVSDQADVVISGGGDGTASNMIPALVNQDQTALGILPFGTINLIAREFGIPVNSPVAVDSQLDGGVQRMDVGVMNDSHYYRTVAGVGFDGEVMHVMNRLRTRRGGRFVSTPAAYFAACGAMYPFAQPSAAEITIDGKTEKTSLFEAWAGNIRLLAYMELRPEGMVDDGLGELTVFPKLSISKFTANAGPVLWRHMRSEPGQHVPAARYYQGKDMVIETKRSMRALVDGEEVSRNPMKDFRIKMLPRTLPVLVPDTGQAKRLFLPH